MLLNSDLKGMFAYKGSLTTPTCDEVVQWVVLEEPLHVRTNGLVSNTVLFIGARSTENVTVLLTKNNATYISAAEGA